MRRASFGFLGRQGQVEGSTQSNHIELPKAVSRYITHLILNTLADEHTASIGGCEVWMLVIHSREMGRLACTQLLLEVLGDVELLRFNQCCTIQIHPLRSHRLVTLLEVCIQHLHSAKRSIQLKIESVRLTAQTLMSVVKEATISFSPRVSESHTE